MRIVELPSLLIFIIAIYYGVFIYSKNPKNRVNRMFLIYCLFTSFFQFIEFILFQISDPVKVLFWYRIYVFWPIIIPILFHFVLIFFNEEHIFKNRLIYFILYTPILIISLLIALQLNVHIFIREFYRWTYLRSGSLKYLIIIRQILVNVISFSLVFLCLLRYLKTSIPIRKQQIKYLLIALSIPIITGSSYSIMFPIFKIRYPIYILIPVSILIQNIFIGIAIWRYELFSFNSTTTADNIISTMSEALFVLDQENNIVDINKQALDLSGYQKANIIGRPLSIFFSDSDFKEIINRRNKNRNNIKNLELLFNKKNGANIYINFSSSRLYDKQNKIAGHVCIINDITEKKKAEIELKKSQNLIQSMLDFANILNTLDDLDDILDYTIITIKQFTDSKRISIMLTDKNNQYLIIKKSVGLSKEIEKIIKIKIGSNPSISNKVFTNGKIMVVNDIEKEGINKKYSNYSAFICAPFICSPLKGSNIKLGVINITNKKNNKPYTEEEINIVKYISYSAAIAINNKLNENKIEDTLLSSIKALAYAIEAKDPYTRGHSDRVSTYAIGIAREIGLPKEKIRSLRVGGILHDIGKIGIPESILLSTNGLTDKEFNVIKQHPIIGDNILKDIEYLELERDIVRHHHERLDGSGYPDGLTDDQISKESKIIAVADCYDAMNSDRPYRNHLITEEIKTQLMELCDTKLDAESVHALFKYLKLKTKKTGKK